MPVVKETTVHDMKTHFSHYASELLDGTYDEIVVKNRSTPTLRILRYEPPKEEGLQFGTAQKLGFLAVDLDAFDALDADVSAMFKEYL